MFLFVKQPLRLVLIGALAQALMLPLLCLSAVYFHHRRVDPHLKSSGLWTLLLWVASLLMMAAGVFELSTRIQTLRPTAAAPPAGDTPRENVE